MYETLFRRLLFPAYESLIRRRGTVRHLAAYERSQWLAPAELQKVQLVQLNALLAHAWQHVPYLQRKWRAHGLDPAPLGEVAELARYPVLTKAEVRANYQDMIAAPWHGRTMTKTTGGSTGEPFRLEYTQESYARRSALMWRGYRWAGADLGRRTIYVWGVPLGASRRMLAKEALFHWIFNRKMLNSFELREDNAESFVDRINSFRPEVVVGYVTPLVEIAQRILQNGWRIRRIRGVITGAEGLSAVQRETIQRAFGAPVFNTYGSREFGLMAAECAEHSGLHVSADHFVVELVSDAGEPVPDGGGQVAVTDLSNYGMPFVRYLIGDTATRSAQPCSCGRGLPLLKAIHGRVLDLIRTADGRLLPGEFFPHLFKDFPGILQYQVIQRDLGSLEVLLVTQTEIDPLMMDRIGQAVRAAVGPQVVVSVRRVESIPLTRSGKRRSTISYVAALPRSADPARSP